MTNQQVDGLHCLLGIEEGNPPKHLLKAKKLKGISKRMGAS